LGGRGITDSSSVFYRKLIDFKHSTQPASAFAEGATHTLTTILHEATHALAHARGVKDTSRQGKYHNRRFMELAGELDLEWPPDAKAHPVSGFSRPRADRVRGVPGGVPP
jgi:hypothetical protein